MPADPVELDLVRAARRPAGGDAFARLVQRYQRPLQGYFARSLRNASTAEECFQETCLRCFRALERFDPDAPGANFRAWMYRIAVHLVRDELRRPGLRGLPLGQDHEPAREPTPEDAAAWEQQRAALQRAVRTLAPSSRQLLLMHHYQGQSYPEIAAVLRVPLGTVKSRMHTALSQLREALRLGEGGPAEDAA